MQWNHSWIWCDCCWISSLSQHWDHWPRTECMCVGRAGGDWKVPLATRLWAISTEWLHWRHKVIWLSTSAKQKEYRAQWQLNRRYRFTCTPGRIAAQYNRHGNCATVTVDTVVLGKFQAACVSKITGELTTFLPCVPMDETEYNRGGCRSFTASDIKCSRSIYKLHINQSIDAAWV